MGMLIWIAGVVILGSVIGYLGTRYNWFFEEGIAGDTWVRGEILMPAIFGIAAWPLVLMIGVPFALILSPIALAVYLGAKASKK